MPERAGTPAVIAALVCLAAVAAAAAGGALFLPGPWYAALAKPAGTPPDWVFPVAWTLLYLAMALAAWLVWRARGLGGALALFALQLAINAAWSPTVFGAHRLGLGLLLIVALWLALAATVRAFWRARPATGALMLPYLAWVAYAAYLNAGLLAIN